MAFENLPGIFPYLHDGNLTISASNENPVVLVIGTAPRGDAETLFKVSSPSEAAQEFGKDDGTLIRGLYEVLAGGAENVRLFRIGAKSAKLTPVGGGITIETVSKDASAGTDYKIFWDDTAERLRVWRVSDDLLVYDNNPNYPSAVVDENEVSVSGATVAGAPGRANIGTLAVPLTLAGANGVGGATYTAGDDGILLSRMELYQELFKAYKLLENEQIDFVVPMNVYLDDLNVADLTNAQISALAPATWSGMESYPTPGASNDILGKVFAQEYEGEWYFWWDINADGVAEIWPDAGSANQVLDAYGTALSASDFHEINFGYQLADFCYRQSEDNQEMHGFIGVKPPTSWSLKDVAAWVGKEPTTAEDANGYDVVTANGTGLLGNRWMAGRRAVPGTGPGGHIIDGISGLADGGFIATDDGWYDGTQQKDRNDHLIDIGKYISVVGAQAILANSTSTTSYVATGAPVYGGMVSSLPANSAPTNKVIRGVRLPFRVSVSKLDALAGKRYVMFQNKSKGNVVADAPTAARPDSDYRRLTTFRIVKACIDAVRSVAEPFLGEPITGARLAALETAIDQALVKLKKAEYIQRFDAIVTSTPTQQVQGEANVELVIVPAFELRQITINVALAAS